MSKSRALANGDFRSEGRSRNRDFSILVLGLLIGALVCLTMLGENRVYLLDWAFGPHVPVISPNVIGLNGGLVTGVVGYQAVAILNAVLGGAATWIPILAFFPIAMVGAARLAGRSQWSRIAAGVIYAVNPFVYNRIYVGHLLLLLGYALLPYAVIAALRPVASAQFQWLVPTLWWAFLTSLSPHFAWIYGVVLIGVAFANVVASRQSLGRVALILTLQTGVFALLNAYLLLPRSSTTLPTQVGQASLSLYQTSSDPHFGLYENVAAMYGFWRIGPGPVLAKDVIAGWPFLMIAILLVVGVGILSSFKKRHERNASPVIGSSDVNSRALDVEAHGHRRSTALSFDTQERNEWRLTIMLLFVGVAGYFLALGNQGPTGWLFLWAYQHVPFFDVMREPQKFLMLLILAYAVFFGWGVDHLSKADLRLSARNTSIAAGVLAIALPLGYTGTIFNGLDGQISPSQLPRSYQTANEIMGRGAGNILALPWHLYMSYPFTGNRVVGNLAPSVFDRGVISGDNVQSGGVQTQSTSPRSSYLQELLLRGEQVQSFGALVAPLGVKYVVLSKTVDWRSYDWLHGQTDLRLVLDTPSLDVWRNKAYAGIGQSVSNPRSVAGFDQLIALSKTKGVWGLLPVGSAEKGSTRPPSISLDGGSTVNVVREISPVAYEIARGHPGWVATDIPFQRGWSLDGQSATMTAEGTVLVRVGPRGGTLVFAPWRLVRLGYLVSVGVFLLALVVLWFMRSNQRRSRVAEGAKK